MLPNIRILDHQVSESQVWPEFVFAFRELAKKLHIPWTEYWAFLDSYIDLSTPEGLAKLEEYLTAQQLAIEQKEALDKDLEFVELHFGSLKLNESGASSNGGSPAAGDMHPNPCLASQRGTPNTSSVGSKNIFSPSSPIDLSHNVLQLYVSSPPPGARESQLNNSMLDASGASLSPGISKDKSSGPRLERSLFSELATPVKQPKDAPDTSASSNPVTNSGSSEHDKISNGTNTEPKPPKSPALLVLTRQASDASTSSDTSTTSFHTADDDEDSDYQDAESDMEDDMSPVRQSTPTKVFLYG